MGRVNEWVSLPSSSPSSSSCLLLMQVEQSYVNALTTAIAYYKTPLLLLLHGDASADRLIDGLFGNINNILNLHRRLCVSIV